MSRLFKVFLFTLFAVTVAFDLLTKAGVDSFVKFGGIGPLRFESHTNSGFILSALTETSPFSRIVFVASLYGFLLFAFVLVQSILPNPLHTLRSGLVLFFSSITSNAIDRIFKGSVTDFICISISTRTVFFNFADVFMWIGTALVLLSLFKSEHFIWHPDSKRKKYLVNSVYQYKWALQTAFVTFSCTIILILFSYAFVFYSTHPLAGPDKIIYLISAATLGLIFSGITFFAGVLLSHRSAGPLYAFERYVDALLRGEAPVFSLRKNDEHQNLVSLAEKLKTRMKHEMV